MLTDVLFERFIKNTEYIQTKSKCDSMWSANTDKHQNKNAGDIRSQNTHACMHTHIRIYVHTYVQTYT